VLVLEGAAKEGVAEGVLDGVEVVHAPGEGDDTIVAVAAGSEMDAEADASVIVVTADRRLAERVRRDGVMVVGPTWLLDRLPPSAL
jgi:rRNA-processing protein FCF1